MNVQITDINETRKTLTVTLDKGEVDGEYNTILGEFTKQVSLPGFRPGKAPAAMVAKRFGKELKDEFKQKIIGKAYRDGLDQSKLEVLSLVAARDGTPGGGIWSPSYGVLGARYTGCSDTHAAYRVGRALH